MEKVIAIMHRKVKAMLHYYICSALILKAHNDVTCKIWREHKDINHLHGQYNVIENLEQVCKINKIL